jgi:hypothetical protein
MEEKSLVISIILSGLLMGILFTAGCEELIVDRNIAIIKMSEHGQVEWTKVIDTAVGDFPRGGALTPDGGYVLGWEDCQWVCDGASRLIKFSSDGKQLWERDINPEDGCRINTINTTRNGDIITTSRYTICRFNPEGQILWNQSSLPFYSTSPLVETDGGQFIVVGLIFNKFTKVQVVDNDGNLTWKQIPYKEVPYHSIGLAVWAYNVTIVTLDPSGTITSQHTFMEDEYADITQIYKSDDRDGYVFYAKPGENSLDKNQSSRIRLDKSGKFIDVTPYNVTAGSSGNPTWDPFQKCYTGVPTRDGGNLSVCLEWENTNVYVEESNPDKSRNWNKVLTTTPVFGVPQMDKIVYCGQSTDGGFYIIGGHVKNVGRHVGSILGTPSDEN